MAKNVAVSLVAAVVEKRGTQISPTKID